MIGLNIQVYMCSTKIVFRNAARRGLPEKYSRNIDMSCEIRQVTKSKLPVRMFQTLDYFINDVRLTILNEIFTTEVHRRGI